MSAHRESRPKTLISVAGGGENWRKIFLVSPDRYLHRHTTFQTLELSSDHDPPANNKQEVVF
jgi:hypothetical protein